MSYMIIILVTPNKIYYATLTIMLENMDQGIELIRVHLIIVNDIDPDLFDFDTDIRSRNTQYFDDQTFRLKKNVTTLYQCVI